ncbi:MAG: hypothetical protein O3A51_13355 [Verrucomicrobia bacterium]|nr:hypothetical protein [Verrucomicrobiota bacterium]
MDAETRSQIIDLSLQAAAVQDSAVDYLQAGELDQSLLQQELSYEILKQIEDLLPKPPPQQQQEDQQEQNPDQQTPENQDQQESRENDAEQPEDNQTPPETPETEAPQSSSASPEDLTDSEVNQLLEKALQREKEHDADVRRRMHDIPLSPMDRDW